MAMVNISDQLTCNLGQMKKKCGNRRSNMNFFQIKSGKEDVYIGTADFIGPPEANDHMGMFCCSVYGSVAMATKFEDSGDDYNSLLVKSLADRLVS